MMDEEIPLQPLGDDEAATSDKSSGGASVQRHLAASHLEMIAIGGTIGTGLFLGSGHALVVAGPLGCLLAFCMVGIFVYFVVASLGEMATLIPVSGSFNDYASRFIEPALGFSMGWNYWFSWAVTLPIEMAAVSLAMRYWSSAPGWIWSALTLLSATLLNLFGVRYFGDAEYVFSLVKIIAIVVFIVLGLFAVVIEGIWFVNWTVKDAPFVNGVSGVFQVFLTAFFAFGGTELVGITAGEAMNPSETVPRAINGTFWRILIFYVCSLFVLGLLVPYNAAGLGDRGTSSSAFTLGLRQANVPIADHIINLVVIVAVLSAANSSMYASSRVLFSMARQDNAPKIFMVTRNGVPIYAMALSFSIAFISLILSFLGAETLFNWLVHLTGFSTLVSWTNICLVHLRFRKAYLKQGKSLIDLPYRAPFFPYGPYIAICGAILVVFGSVVSLIARKAPFVEFVQLLLGFPLFPALYFGYKHYRPSTLVPLEDCDFSSHR